MALLSIYGLAPLVIYVFFDRNPYMLSLGLMSCVAAAVVVIGFVTPLFDRWTGDHRFKLAIPHDRFQAVVWGTFALFFSVTLFTAENVPLFSALFGSYGAEELAAQRGAFMKTRQGWEASLGYIGGVFAGLLLPFSLAMLFIHRSPARFGALALFILFSLSYLQKALFVQVVTPLAYLSARKVIWSGVGLAVLLGASVALLYLNTVLARGIQPESRSEQLLERRQTPSRAGGTSPYTANGSRQISSVIPPDFFNSGFRPASATEHLAWRLISVPIFTASDAIRVKETKFRDRFFYGATSSFVAAVFGLERVNFDAEVFAAQWGQSQIGRANSVYVTDGYVNFGWAGVVGFSFLVGLAFRLLSKAENEAIRAMWPLLAYNILQASLIGTLLSSGFLIIFIFAVLVKFKLPTREQTV